MMHSTIKCAYCGQEIPANEVVTNVEADGTKRHAHWLCALLTGFEPTDGGLKRRGLSNTKDKGVRDE